MNLLSINPEKCIKCGICIQSCPVSIIEFDSGNGLPTVKAENENNCVVCGHCESVCPQFALTHNTSGAQLILSAGNAYISSDNLGTYFRNRRSIRKYLQKPIEKHLLEQVMDIVRYAPTGTNQQRNQWIIIQNKKVIDQLAQGTITWMKNVSSIDRELAERLNFAGLIAAFESGSDVICRHAPVLIIGYAKASYNIGLKDVVIATSHLELLLPSFGLGGCWAGYLMAAMQNSSEVKKIIRLDDTVSVHSALMVGYPKYSYYKIPSRKEADVHWI